MRKNNAGFTLVEVVIAVTIAVLVSIAAASVILVTRTQSAKATQKNNAVAQAGTVLECFKASQDMADFEKALEFAYGLDYDIETDGSGDTEDYTYYLYFNEDGSNCKTDAETGTSAKKIKTVSSEDKRLVCSYYVTIKLDDCKKLANGSYGFSASSKLNISVKAANGSDIYTLTKAYVKGVTD